jgi:hypothetical protein
MRQNNGQMYYHDNYNFRLEFARRIREMRDNSTTQDEKITIDRVCVRYIDLILHNIPECPPFEVRKGLLELFGVGGTSL